MNANVFLVALFSFVTLANCDLEVQLLHVVNKNFITIYNLVSSFSKRSSLKKKKGKETERKKLLVRLYLFLYILFFHFFFCCTFLYLFRNFEIFQSHFYSRSSSFGKYYLKRKYIKKKKRKDQ